MSRSLRRLMKEASELSNSPSPHFHAQPVSESNLYDWHFTLAGPPAPSPYAGGIYHGRIVLPSTYPLRPPSFRFLTPSGRFEVNREICLSISGHHEETWQPAWGIRTALLAIRSFMDGDVKGQVGGLEVSDEVRREYARLSRGWCCDICEGGGKSNEEVLRAWRVFCVEKGVDVDREDESEDVPEELRLALPASTSTSPPVSSSAATEAPDSAEKDGGGSGQASAESSASMAGHVSTTTTTTTTTTEIQTSSTQHVGPQQLQRQQPVSMTVPPRSNQVAPPGSQDSPWLDRAIFGVLVALIVMILRRFVDVED